MSGFSKYDKITPVITLTVYFGSGEWDAPRSLYGMFDEKDASLLPFVDNYKINLIVPGEIQDMEKFSSDMRYVMEFIKASEEKERDMCKAIDDMIKDEKIEGKIEATRENILDLPGELGTISEPLREKVSEQSDFDILKQWHKLSAKVSSVDEFEEKM